MLAILLLNPRPNQITSSIKPSPSSRSQRPVPDRESKTVLLIPGMNDGHMHGGMDGSMGMAPPTMNGTGTMVHPHRRMMMMHMTFFWGKNSEILFSGWPGTDSGMYALALVFVFFLAFIVEWLSHSRFIKQEANHVAAGLAQTLMHALRVGLAYLVMLAVMSFNAGVFIVAVAGHTLGFFFFGSRVFKKSPESVPPSGKTSDLPPMSC